MDGEGSRVKKIVADLYIGAVVVAGARAITQGKGAEWGLSLYTPVIVKYRDAKTDARVELEDILR